MHSYIYLYVYIHKMLMKICIHLYLTEIIRKYFTETLYPVSNNLIYIHIHIYDNVNIYKCICIYVHVSIYRHNIDIIIDYLNLTSATWSGAINYITYIHIYMYIYTYISIYIYVYIFKSIYINLYI
jgi:hypothetical protein